VYDTKREGAYDPDLFAKPVYFHYKLQFNKIFNRNMMKRSSKKFSIESKKEIVSAPFPQERKISFMILAFLKKLTVLR